MIRARFAELRAADPFLYVIESEYVDSASVAGMRGVEAPTLVQWGTSYHGSLCFLATSLDDYGGVLKCWKDDKEAARRSLDVYVERGAYLAVFETRSYAELSLECFLKKYKLEKHSEFYRVREVVKATGKLVPLVD
jgi:hypothetical protein